MNNELMNFRSCKLAYLPSQKSFSYAGNGGIFVFPCQSVKMPSCSNFPKYGQLILKKNISIVATRCQFLVQNGRNSTSAPPHTPLG